MSTRGAVGFYKNGVEKIGYNHFDSYPDGLGNKIIAFLKGKTVEKLNEIFDGIDLVEDDYDVETWNNKKNEFNKVINDAKDFMFDSLFCEFAYIINLDNNTLEFYEGDNRHPNGKGRYASHYDGSEFYGVVLKDEIPLDKFFNGEVTADDEKDKFIYEA